MCDGVHSRSARRGCSMTKASECTKVNCNVKLAPCRDILRSFYLYLLSKRYALSLFLKAAHGRDGDGKENITTREQKERKNLINQGT